MLIKRSDKGAHWYLKDGSPFYTVPNATSGGMRSTTIRDAFKAGAYRSVTNVLSVLDKPGLDAWRQEQCVLSALTLPRGEFENDSNFAERVMADADEQARKARERGERLHELASGWLLSGEIPAPYSEVQMLEPFTKWCLEYLHPESGVAMQPESVMLNHEHYYAGRVDLPVRMADGSIAILDLKTTEVKRDDKDRPKPEFYPEWAMQLAAYSKCVFADGSYAPPMPWRLFSLVVDTATPGLYVKEWTDSANPIPSTEPHWQAFLAACRLWEYLKGGVPGRDVKKIAA